MKTTYLKCLCAAIALSCLSTAHAQQTGKTDRLRHRSINVELFGPYLLGGISYDARFKKTSPWGFRTGLGFGLSKSGGFFGSSNSTAYSIPIEANYLLGKKRSKLELGLGVNLGLYHDKYEILFPLVSGSLVKASTNHFDAFAFATIGYRYVSKRGFQFRCGITPAVVMTNNRDNGGEVYLAPFFSFGKAF